MLSSFVSLQHIAEEKRKAEERRAESLAVLCSFCNKTLSKYTCPRCSKKYCGLECYKSRGHAKCSNAFQREQRNAEAKATNSTKQEKEKMKEILKKNQFVAPDGGGPLEFVGDASPNLGLTSDGEIEYGVDEDEEGNSEESKDEEYGEEEDEETIERRKDLGNRMEGLDIEGAEFEEIWGRLNTREREEFVRLAQQLEDEEKSTRILE
jgi:HIT zinc finger